MLVAGFPSEITATNCWIVAPGDGEQCIVIDPGIGVGGWVDETIAQHRLQAVAVLATHGHLDHTFSVVPVCRSYEVPAYIHPDDRGQLTDPWAALGVARGTPIMGLTSLPAAEPQDVRTLSDGERLTLAGLDFTVRHAPGHTPGSVTFVLDAEPVLFSGDVLFAGSIGRVDLPGGSMAQMLDSLTRTVLSLSDDIVVHPGHGPSTTIGRERRTNPYLQEMS